MGGKIVHSKSCGSMVRNIDVLFESARHYDPILTLDYPLIRLFINSTTSRWYGWVLVLSRRSILWLEAIQWTHLRAKQVWSLFLFTAVLVTSFKPLTDGMNFSHIFAVNPDGDLITQNGYLLVNNLCALAGYYCAAYVIDKPRIGRKKLQMYSNIACMIIFLVAGGIFNSASPSVLMFLFFLSSFTVNFGPNVTTYVMAAETYPTELRATLHGSE